jgi:hypothetical protein
VSTKPISTSIAVSTCDVCGRTLLRGERAEIYVSGGTRRSVCELCTSRALHGGWVREGTVPSYQGGGARIDRRRSLLGRLRPRRDPALASESALESDDQPAGETRPGRAPRASRAPVKASAPSFPDPSVRNGAGRSRGGIREPRHVRAVPTSIEHKISSAMTLFNSSEHPRTVAGIGRSLGLPEVTVLATEAPSVVNIVVSWELCWYRYEVDLSDEIPSVRVAGQGYELAELTVAERVCNAEADDRGLLSVGPEPL